jgi:hypothetical protein
MAHPEAYCQVKKGFRPRSEHGLQWWSRWRRTVFSRQAFVAVLAARDYLALRVEYISRRRWQTSALGVAVSCYMTHQQN